VPIAKRLRDVFKFSGGNTNGESFMRKELALLASVAALFTFIAASAQAMPAASLAGASNSDQVIHVAEGCGRGWHRGPHGHCRRN
jgi:Spy/CpxP family protein refolding chaperone